MTADQVSGHGAPPDAAEPHRYDAFLSYARSDQPTATRLSDALDARRKQIWVDVESIPGGSDWSQRIDRGIVASKAFVFLLTPASAASPRCCEELRRADALKKLIVPVVGGAVERDDWPPELRQRQHIVLGGPAGFEDAIERLDRELETDLAWRDLHTRIAVRAGEWVDERGDRSFLLRGADLRKAESWLAEQGDHGQRATDEQVEYIVRGRRAAGNRRRTWTAGAAVAVAVAAVLGTLALAKSREATRESRKVLSQQLARELRNVFTEDLGLAGALAAEALRITPTAEARATASSMLDQLAFTQNQIGTFGGEHNRGAFDLAFDPDGRTVVSGAEDGSLRLWDVATRRPIGRRFTGHEAPVNSVAFSSDGTTIASASFDGTVRLWNATTQRQIGSPLRGHDGVVLAVAFSPDGEVLASGGRDDTLRLWSVSRHTPLGRPLVGHRGNVAGVAFSPDGRLLASGSRDGTVRLWNARTGRPSGGPLKGHTAGLFDVAFSPDSRLVASSASDKTVRLWDVRRHAAAGRPLLGHRDRVFGVAFNRDGSTLASASEDGSVRRWHVATHQPVVPLPLVPPTPNGQPTKGVTVYPNAVAYGADGRTLAVAASDGSLRLWDAPATPMLRFLDGHRGGTEDVAFLAGGRLVASAGRDRRLRLWNVERRREVGPAFSGHTGTVRDLALSADGKLMASAGLDGTVRLWNVATHRQRSGPLRGHAKQVLAIALTPDGTLAASGGSDGTLRLWDVAGHRQIGAPIMRSGEFINDLAFGPGGRVLASAGRDGTVRLWDPRTRRQIGDPLTGHNSANTVAFSADGRMLASGGSEGTIRLWDVASRLRIGEPLVGHGDNVYDVAFSPDAKTLASASRDRTIVAWDVAAQKRIGNAINVGVQALALAFSPDGTSLVAGGGSPPLVLRDTVLWSDDPRTLRHAICSRVRRNLSRAEWERYLPDEPYRRTCVP